MREQLEATLRARWDREALAVYGDYLMAEGDPRGDMIAIDLAIDERGSSPELAARRDQLIRDCFGDTIPPGTMRYGFFDVDATSAAPSPQLEAAFSGPAAAYVRSIVICGTPATLHDALAAVASVPRPWLQRLALRQWSESKAAPYSRLAGALIAATPHLDTLELDGRNVLDDLAHPTLLRLRVSGYDATASLVRGDAPLPNLLALDFAFQSHLADRQDSPGERLRSMLLAPARFPALVELDLSRNEPGKSDPCSLGGTVDICRFLHDLAIAPQLERVRLPSVRAPRTLQAALARMPALRSLVIARGELPDVRHPTATITLG